VTADAVAVKLPERRPAATAIVEGTWTAALVLDRLTVTPPTGAGPLSVTVPVAVPGPVSTLGLKANEPTTTGTGLMMKVTGTMIGELDAPVAVIAMLSLYVPGFRPDGLAAMLMVDGAVPEVWLGMTHVWDAAAVQVSVPPPVLEIVRETGDEFPPPCVAEKEMLGTDTWIIGLTDWSRMETPPPDEEFGTRMSGAPSPLMSPAAMEAGFVTGMVIGVKENVPSPLPRKIWACRLG